MTPPWNTDWETVDPALLWDVDVFNLFLAAVNERYGRWDQPPFPDVTIDNNPAYALFNLESHTCTSWMQMQSVVNNLGKAFARKYDADGNLIDYTAQPFILRYQDDWAFDQWLFRRWHPREINSLSDAGIAGQRARFIRRATITPSDQAVLSGLYFEHDGTQWVHDPDLTDADQIWDYGISQPDGGAGNPASVFGPHILADLQSALKLCVQEFRTGYWGAPRSMTTSSQASGQTVGNPPATVDSGLLATAKASAESAWAASAGNNGTILGSEIFFGVMVGPAAFSYIGPVGVNGFGAALRRSYATAKTDITPSNPALAHAAMMFLVPYDPSLATVRGNAFVATEPDANGDGIPMTNMQLLQDFGTSTQTSFTGPVVGDSTLGIPLPWPTVPAGMKVDQAVMRGYDYGAQFGGTTTQYVQLLLKWDVPGGFTYT